MDDNRQRQCDELEALQAMCIGGDDDVELLGAHPCEASPDSEVRFKVESRAGFFSMPCAVIVTLPPDYPAVARPIFDIEGQVTCAGVVERMNALAAERLGEECIYDVLQALDELAGLQNGDETLIDVQLVSSPDEKGYPAKLEEVLPTPKKMLPGKDYFRSDLLGEGGFGAVMTVYDEDGGEYAAKRFEEGDDGTLDYTTLREVALLAALRREAVTHPNIMELHDMCMIDGQLCSVMQRVPMTLAGVIDGKALRKQSEKLKVSKGLFRGMTFLHSNGVMHRDIKTANILLTSDFEPKIIDFSLAKVFAFQEAVAHASDLEAAGKTRSKKKKRKEKKRNGDAVDIDAGNMQNTEGCGTPAFMPPEIFKGEAYNSQADIWSLGLCVLSLFHELFHAELMEIDREKVAHAKIAEWRAKLSVEKPLPCLLRRLLDIDASLRPTAQEALLEICKLSGDAETPSPEQKLSCFSSPTSTSIPANSKKVGPSGKISSWFGSTEIETAIKKWFNVFMLKNPMTRIAANSYFQRCIECRGNGAAEVPLLSCVILAARLFEPDLPDPLDDLEYVQDWADEMESDEDEIWNFDIDAYKEHEYAILTSMEYCLYVAPPA